MKTSKKEQIFQEIRRHRQGWAFSAADFMPKFERREINESLSYLTESGDIRRVAQGIYDYPTYNPLLHRHTAPDIHQASLAIARKHNWNVFPDGDTALNYLGLSTQMVAKHIYLSDGPNRKYQINGIPVEFKHLPKKDVLTKNKNTTLIIQAIRAVGEEHITEDFTKRLSKLFSAQEWEKIYSEAHISTDWIYSVIKKAHLLAKQGEQNG